MGVWIEIFKILPMALAKLSLPLWECGLKSVKMGKLTFPCGVTPLVGVWIEIKDTQKTLSYDESLPLWECGLKL